jgi:hypothetical protein
MGDETTVVELGERVAALARTPRIEDLVALKLDAGGPKDLADVVELLR